MSIRLIASNKNEVYFDHVARQGTSIEGVCLYAEQEFFNNFTDNVIVYVDNEIHMQLEN